MSAAPGQDANFAMYENIAACAIRRHGKDSRKLRRALNDAEAELFLATSPSAKAGLEHLVKRLVDELREIETRASGEPVPERYP